MLTYTLWKVSRISFSYFSFLHVANLLGKGIEITLEEITTLQVILGAKVVSIKDVA